MAAVVASWDFAATNDLIDKHNRWYPVEARLAMNPRTRDYVDVGGRPYRRERLDAAWVLARFPTIDCAADARGGRDRYLEDERLDAEAEAPRDGSRSPRSASTRIPRSASSRGRSRSSTTTCAGWPTG